MICCRWCTRFVLVKLWIVEAVYGARTVFSTYWARRGFCTLFAVRGIRMLLVFAKKQNNKATNENIKELAFRNTRRLNWVIYYRKHRLHRVGHRTCGWKPNGQSGSATLGIFIYILGPLFFFGAATFRIRNALLRLTRLCQSADIRHCNVRKNEENKIKTFV